MGLQIYVATTSAGKLRDFNTAATAHGIEFVALPNLKQIEPPEEDGLTFEENAALKAVYYSRFIPGQFVLADDSGLEVDALGGLPGVRSARFAADAGIVPPPDAFDNTDAANNQLLLDRLSGVSADRRTARYRAALALARDAGVVATSTGCVEGIILESPRGDGGFGYDPLFFLPELDQTMAEISLETKLGLSHRGRAIAALVSHLSI